MSPLPANTLDEREAVPQTETAQALAGVAEWQTRWTQNPVRAIS
jgi:hypothetical protein